MQRQASDNFHNLSPPPSDNDYMNVSHPPQYLRNAKELTDLK